MGELAIDLIGHGLMTLAIVIGLVWLYFGAIVVVDWAMFGEADVKAIGMRALMWMLVVTIICWAFFLLLFIGRVGHLLSQ